MDQNYTLTITYFRKINPETEPLEGTTRIGSNYFCRKLDDRNHSLNTPPNPKGAESTDTNSNHPTHPAVIHERVIIFFFSSYALCDRRVDKVTAGTCVSACL